MTGRKLRGAVVAVLALAAASARAQGSAPPPPDGTGSGYAPPPAEVRVERGERPNPLGTVALDAGYGGVAGLLVGGGVALVRQEDWGRSIMVGAGVGLIVGAVAGVVHAVWQQQQWDRGGGRAAAEPPGRPAVADDGLGRTARDPVITAPTLGLSVKF